jgi:hypothetical protein
MTITLGVKVVLPVKIFRCVKGTFSNYPRGHYKILNPQYLVDLEIPCLFKDMPDDSPAIALKHLTSLPFTLLFLTLS